MRLLLPLLFGILLGCASKQPPSETDYDGDPPPSRKEASQDSSGEDRPEKGEIDLGFDGDYGKIDVEEGQAASTSTVTCETHEDCAGMAIPEAEGPGEYRCVSATCVFEKAEEDAPADESVDTEINSPED